MSVSCVVQIAEKVCRTFQSFNIMNSIQNYTYLGSKQTNKVCRNYLTAYHDNSMAFPIDKSWFWTKFLPFWLLLLRRSKRKRKLNQLNLRNLSQKGSHGKIKQPLSRLLRTVKRDFMSFSAPFLNNVVNFSIKLTIIIKFLLN